MKYALLPAAADRDSGIRLTKSEDRKTDNIINRPGRSTYLEEKSVLTSETTPLDNMTPDMSASGAGIGPELN